MRKTARSNAARVAKGTAAGPAAGNERDWDEAEVLDTGAGGRAAVAGAVGV